MGKTSEFRAGRAGCAAGLLHVVPTPSRASFPLTASGVLQKRVGGLPQWLPREVIHECVHQSHHHCLAHSGCPGNCVPFPGVGLFLAPMRGWGSGAAASCGLCAEIHQRQQNDRCDPLCGSTRTRAVSPPQAQTRVRRLGQDVHKGRSVPSRRLGGPRCTAASLGPSLVPWGSDPKARAHGCPTEFHSRA